MFYIEVTDVDDTTFVLDAFIEKEADYIDIYIGDTHNGMRLNTCVHILLKENDKEAVLEDYNYRQTCTINHPLTAGENTHRMLKGALKYVIQTYPTIEVIHLSDVAQKKGTRVYLTPKRLLLGKPGWYEEHFGATPTQKTIYYTMKAKKSFTHSPETIKRISKQSWGKSEDLEDLSREAGKLIHSDWTISRHTINNYTVNVRSFQSGGHIHKYSIHRLKNSYMKEELKAIESKLGRRSYR